MQECFNFFNQGWVGSLIGIIGIILGVIGIFSYKVSKSTARPSYQKSSLRLLGKNESNLPSDVTVLFKGKEVERLCKTTLILWNNGTEVLNKEDVVDSDPLKISFNSGDNILSIKILKTTKDVNNIKVLRDELNSHLLHFKFNYLDPGDGIAIELLHDSKMRYPTISGTIKGLPNGFEDLGRFFNTHLFSNKSNSKFPFNVIARSPKLILWSMFIAGMVISLFGFFPQKIFTIEFIEKFNFNMKKFEQYIMLIVGVLYMIMPLSLLWLRRRRYPKQLDVVDSES